MRLPTTPLMASHSSRSVDLVRVAATTECVHALRPMRLGVVSAEDGRDHTVAGFVRRDLPFHSLSPDRRKARRV